MNTNRTIPNEREPRTSEHMKRLFLGGLLAATTLLGGFALTSTAAFATDDDEQIVVEPDDRVCDQPPAHQPPVPSTTKTMLLIAPEGKVIVATCVKAGSAIQGEGPDYKTYGEGVASVTISHPSGKDISHYTVTYADKPLATATASVAYTAPSCAAAAIVILSEGVGYTWSSSGTDEARTYTATAATGYQMTEPSVFGPYRLTKLTEGCAPIVESQPPPPAAPPAQVQVASNAPIAPAPAAATPAAAAPATPISTQLPSTGSSSWVTALIALVALAGGTGLVRLSRRPTD